MGLEKAIRHGKERRPYYDSRGVADPAVPSTLRQLGLERLSAARGVPGDHRDSLLEVSLRQVWVAGDLLQALTMLASGLSEIVISLEPHPEIGSATEESGELEGRQGRDRTLSPQDFANRRLRHLETLGELIGGHPHRLHEVLSNHVPWMRKWNQFL
jgi:hypothetical protein